MTSQYIDNHLQKTKGSIISNHIGIKFGTTVFEQICNALIDRTGFSI